MSKQYRPYEPDQRLLLPPNLDEWLSEDHMARFVRDVVGELDLGEITRYYEREDRGFPPYHPRMMTQVLFYAYVVGIPSSRKIERKLQEDVAFRFLAAGNQPDFRTVAEFRRRHLGALSKLFVQVLRLCQEAGLVKLGHVSLDSTKVKANASKHKAMSYDRMIKSEVQLEKEIRELLQSAQETDENEDRQYGKDKRGDELPEELSRRVSRLDKIRQAKAALEAKAKKEADQKREARQQLEKAAAEEGKKVSGTPPKIDDQPSSKAQRNFTDPESSIMKGNDGGFIQAYNCQAGVDGSSQVIVACEVSAIAADGAQVEPMVVEMLENLGELPKIASMDAGFFSEANIQGLQDLGVDPYIAAGRQKHTQQESPAPPRGRIPRKATPKDRMQRKLRTRKGRRIYARRKAIVEPVFGQIKGRGFRQFLLRGKQKVRSEWSLICMTHNLRKLYGRMGGRWIKN
jgi:transposase